LSHKNVKSALQEVLVGAKFGWFSKHFFGDREDSWRDGRPMANGFLAYLLSRDFFVILGNREM